MKYEESMLSGFIDGELSPAEEQIVQRQLAASPKDRQLLEALSNLHAKLSAAPAEIFSSDPVQGVRSRIAQGDPDAAAQLAAAKNLRTDSAADDQPSSAAAHQQTPPQQTAPQPTARQSNPRDGWRITRWLALAVAASLTGLLLWLPQRNAQTLTDNLAPSAEITPPANVAENPTARQLPSGEPSSLKPDATQDATPTNAELALTEGSEPEAVEAEPNQPQKLLVADPAARADRQAMSNVAPETSNELLSVGSMPAPPRAKQPTAPLPKPFRIGGKADQVLSPLEQPLSTELTAELNRRFVAIELPAERHLIAARFIANQLRTDGQERDGDSSPNDNDDSESYGATAPAASNTLETTADTESSPTAILVEGTPEELASLVQSLRQWTTGGGENPPQEIQTSGSTNRYTLDDYAASQAPGNAASGTNTRGLPPLTDDTAIESRGPARSPAAPAPSLPTPAGDNDAAGAIGLTTDLTPAAATPLTELGPEVREGVLAGRLWIVLLPQPAAAQPLP